MTPRRPRSALTTTALPSLAIGSSLVAGCAQPTCGDTRAAELSAHAAPLQEAVSRGQPDAALREFAIATGLRAHPILPAPELHTAGEPMVVEPVPQVEPPPLARGGDEAVVNPLPVAPSVAPPSLRRSGGIRSHGTTQR